MGPIPDSWKRIEDLSYNRIFGGFTQHHVKNPLSSCYVAVTAFEVAAQREVLVTLALGTSVPGDYVARRIGSAASRRGENISRFNL